MQLQYLDLEIGTFLENVRMESPMNFGMVHTFMLATVRVQLEIFFVVSPVCKASMTLP